STNTGTRFAIERAVDSNGVAGSWQMIKGWNDNFTSETFIDSSVNPAAKYWYRVKSYNSDGVINDTPSNEVSAASLSVKSVTAANATVYNNLVEPDKNQPLYIKFDLPAEENVIVTIYDLSGQEIKEIVDNERKPAGVNIIEWAGKNMDNEIVASGSYIVYIKAGDFVEKKKILVVR
ncbi:MAG: FlgD immunoglobulin-like domain containing protein, partial [Elusimicrobiota bacterium]